MSRSQAQRERERCLAILREQLGYYPTSLFREPPPGHIQPGYPRDCYGASAIRWVLETVMRKIENPSYQPTEAATARVAEAPGEAGSLPSPDGKAVEPPSH